VGLMPAVRGQRSCYVTPNIYGSRCQTLDEKECSLSPNCNSWLTRKPLFDQEIFKADVSFLENSQAFLLISNDLRAVQCIFQTFAS
jgi:hypothetical protein